MPVGDRLSPVGCATVRSFRRRAGSPMIVPSISQTTRGCARTRPSGTRTRGTRCVRSSSRGARSCGGYWTRRRRYRVRSLAVSAAARASLGLPLGALAPDVPSLRVVARRHRGGHGFQHPPRMSCAGRATRARRLAGRGPSTPASGPLVVLEQRGQPRQRRAACSATRGRSAPGRPDESGMQRPVVPEGHPHVDGRDARRPVRDRSSPGRMA